MSDMIYKSGLDIRKILNKSFAKYETTHAKHIVLGLDKSNIPYFARFGNTSISLTYDADYKDSVDEIITKAMSGDFGEFLCEIKDKKNSEGYLILLPEIAPMLHTTVGALKNRPSEIQESLCRTYVNYWLCDTPTIQRELSRVMNINSKTEQEIQKAEAKEYQANNIPEKREAINSADIQHRMNVIDGDDEHQKKVWQTEQEKARVGYITRENIAKFRQKNWKGKKDHEEIYYYRKCRSNNSCYCGDRGNQESEVAYARTGTGKKENRYTCDRY